LPGFVGACFEGVCNKGSGGYMTTLFLYHCIVLVALRTFGGFSVTQQVHGDPYILGVIHIR
jgi:hypothetical protein